MKGKDLDCAFSGVYRMGIDLPGYPVRRRNDSAFLDGRDALSGLGLDIVYLAPVSR